MLAKCQLFAGLTEEALAAIESKMQMEAPKERGEVLFHHGSDATSMYFLLAGEVEIQTNDGARLDTVGESGFFGEIGVLFAGQRTACAVVSKGPCQLAVLHRTDLMQIATAHS